MKFLVTGISLLQNDPYLQLKMGGVTLNNAGVLANTLKSKVSELDIRSRIEPTADLLLRHEYGKPTLRELAPGRRNAAKIDIGGSASDPRVGLDILAGSWKGTGVGVPETSKGSGISELRKPNSYQYGVSFFSGRSGDGIFWGEPAK